MQSSGSGVPSRTRPHERGVASPSSKKPSKPRKPRAPGDPLPARMPQRSPHHYPSYEKFVKGEMKSQRRKRGDGRKDKTVFKDRQGRFCRVPKPKPAPQPTPQDPPAQDEGYESCDDMSMQQITRPLLRQAEQVESQLHDPALAALLAALCGQLRRVDEERRDIKAHNSDLTERVSSLKVKLSNKRAQLSEQQAANQNLHGQATRYWTRIRKLQRQLYRSKVDRFDPPTKLLSFRRPDD